MDWQSAPFLIKSNLECPKNLEGLWIDRPKVVLKRASKGAWDEFGVRDPALLVDSRGYLFREKGALVLYYTGSHKSGLCQGIGRAVSHDEGRTWHRSPERPVLIPPKDAWDSPIATTPWVVRDDEGIYRLYYRGARGIYKDEGIGLALSRDGINFERVGSKPLLTKADFADFPKKGRTLMAVTNVVQMFDGRYLLTFEGISASFGYIQIFGAISKDGEHFKPLNKGCPIFSANQVKSWIVQRVANPRITVLEEEGIYMLAFNAHYNSGFYAIGFAFTKDFKDWREHPGNPFILPSGSPLDGPFSGRIEGVVVAKEDIEQGRNPMRVFLMGIPRRGPSHKGGVVGLAQGWIRDARSKYSFRIVSDQPRDVNLLPAGEGESEIVCLRQSADSLFPPQIYFSFFNQGSLQGISFDIFVESADKGSAFIVLGDDISTLNTVEGIRLGFEHSKIYLRVGWVKTKRSLSMLLQKIIGRYNLTWCRWLRWRRLGSYKENAWHVLCVEKEKGKWVIKLNGCPFVSLADGRSVIHDIYSLGIKSAGQSIKIRNLKVSFCPKSSDSRVQK